MLMSVFWFQSNGSSCVVSVRSDQLSHESLFHTNDAGVVWHCCLLLFLYHWIVQAMHCWSCCKPLVSLFLRLELDGWMDGWMRG